MFKLLLVLAVLPLIALAEYPVISCGTGAGVPVSISIDGCPGPVCEIRRGSNVNYNVVYNPTHSGSAITIRLLLTMGSTSITVPLTPSQANGCNNLVSGSCPYSAGQRLEHRNSIPVPFLIPVGQRALIQATYSSPSGTHFCASIEGYAV